jgi:hypothetical protein
VISFSLKVPKGFLIIPAFKWICLELMKWISVSFVFFLYELLLSVLSLTLLLLKNELNLVSPTSGYADLFGLYEIEIFFGTVFIEKLDCVGSKDYTQIHLLTYLLFRRIQYINGLLVNRTVPFVFGFHFIFNNFLKDSFFLFFITKKILMVNVTLLKES